LSKLLKRTQEKNEVGVQARTLAPGLHLLIPFLYSVRKLPFTVIATMDGEPMGPAACCH